MRISCADFIQKVVDMIDQKVKPIIHAINVKNTKSDNMSEEEKEMKSFNKNLSSDDEWETKSKPRRGNLMT